jgi:hypothetical protein
VSACTLSRTTRTALKLSFIYTAVYEEAAKNRSVTSGSSTGSYCHATVDSGTLQLLCTLALPLSSAALSQDASDSLGSIALLLPLPLLFAAPNTNSVEGLRAADASTDVSRGDSPLLSEAPFTVGLLVLAVVMLAAVAAVRAALSAAELGDNTAVLLLLLPVVAAVSWL